jgi:hypothetical protein
MIAVVVVVVVVVVVLVVVVKSTVTVVLIIKIRYLSLAAISTIVRVAYNSAISAASFITDTLVS